MGKGGLVDRWQRLDVGVRDAIGAAGLLGVALLPGMAESGADLPEYPVHRPLDALGWTLVALVALPLALRRRSPVVAVVVTAAAFIAYEAIGYPLSAATVGFPFALYAIGAHQKRGRRALALTLAACYLPFVVVIEVLGSTQTVLQYVIFLGILAAFWAVGHGMRRQRAAAERHRQDSMALAVATERQSIARELHDVVTHHVTAMVLQADAARLVLTAAPEQARAGVAAVSGTGREALVELRHLLHVLDAEEGTAEHKPAGGRIEDLVERTRALGQPVSWRQEGRPQPARGADLAIYRVVQESLTNAVKYAHGKPTVVHIAHTGDDVAVQVTTKGTSAMTGEVVRSGRGLNGLRQRVSMAGGDFEAGPTAGGEFVVRARIPLGAGA
jgi:signal transduction histidine kinase